MVADHQDDRAGTEQPHAVQLAPVQDHLMESEVVGGGRVQAGLSAEELRGLVGAGGAK